MTDEESEEYEVVELGHMSYRVPKLAADKIRKNELMRFAVEIKKGIEALIDTTGQRGHGDFNAGITSAIIVVLRVLGGEK